jgi:crotonobetainyl-CoA:carnitine CoA-transferase CaiB-like acyl-CoA transferase
MPRHATASGDSSRAARPLDGVRVLDFSTLLPGPLATLLLAEAGAEVIKIERPGEGDGMRAYPPKLGAGSLSFALLNRGKRSLAVDLKDPDQVARLLPLVAEAQVLVEQFRPGVMDRLGLGWETLKRVNPALVYCAITGYGQSGPKAQTAGHDLTYLADTGLLALAADHDGAPVVPPGLIADIGGGSLPAVIDILLALRRAEATGEGCYLDVAMCDNLFAWQFWAQAQLAAGAGPPRPGGELLTGGSPRYQIYRTADGRYLAAAPLEQKFWDTFCRLIGLPEALRDDAGDPAATIRAVAAIVAARPAGHWQRLFAGEDACCALVRSLEAALEDPQFQARGLFAAGLSGAGATLSALPVPLAPALRAAPDAKESPALGEARDLLEDG